MAGWAPSGCHQQNSSYVSTNQQKGSTSLPGFRRMHIPNYSQIVSRLYHVTQKKNDFEWGPEQRQAFEQIKREIVHAIALGPVQSGRDVKNVLHIAAKENGPTWKSLAESTRADLRSTPGVLEPRIQRIQGLLYFH